MTVSAPPAQWKALVQIKAIPVDATMVIYADWPESNGETLMVVKREELKSAQRPDDSGKTEKAKRIPESEEEGREKE